jgi:hypothetical protein
LETLLKHSLLLTSDDPIPLETLLKHSLLLTHGTVYADPNEGFVYSVPGMTNSKEQWNYVGYDWWANSFIHELQPTSVVATMFSSMHLDSYYTQAGVAAIPFNGLADHFEQPNMLLTRL